MTHVAFRLPTALVAQVDEIATASERTRSAVVRLILRRFVESGMSLVEATKP